MYNLTLRNAFSNAQTSGPEVKRLEREEQRLANIAFEVGHARTASARIMFWQDDFGSDRTSNDALFLQQRRV
ncbi:hypothetical protein [Sinorhizobium meliloti]|uniref:hypothetical protein n=1 Tax=Rhizobium meliloti TaxID=382 RepID=UPI000FE1354E|nr:hypothetical protein [Sinorhizobium meliloti]RVL90334.1 hypothetical protein CN136_32280 [Sinorhizobium meliloti]